MKLYKIKLKGMGMNEFGPDGVWITKEQLDFVSKAQYDDELRDKVRKFCGRWFPPSAFETVLEERELKEIVESSVSMNKDLLESLAEEGYLPEVKKACLGTGYSGFVDTLVDSGKYKMIEANNEQSPSQASLKRLEEMKKGLFK